MTSFKDKDSSLSPDEQLRKAIDNQPTYSFKDNTGKVWVIRVNVSTIRRVKEYLEIDLRNLADDKMKPLGELLSDELTFVNVLYVLCQDQADKQGITDEQFGAAMYGDVIEEATNAFLEAWQGFFRGPRREAIKKVLAAGKKVGESALTKATARAEAVLAKFDHEAAADRLLNELTNSFGSAPESLGSTPAPTP
jgi:hypothetical protein